MRFLHTSDWHLGITLEGRSRIAEQKALLDELVALVAKENIQCVLLSGDIYDSYHPSPEAETLFYSAMQRLTMEKSVPIIVIAGNHDHPDRLTAASSWANPLGIFLLGTPASQASTGQFAGYSATFSEKGVLELQIGNETVVIAAMPFPSEKRLRDGFGLGLEESPFQKEYSKKIGSLFAQRAQFFRPDTINIGMGHFYVVGGLESPSERPIQMGGAYAVHASDLPAKAQYIALGHLHRRQRTAAQNAFYSGSLLQMDKGEANLAKSVNIVEVKAGEEAKIEKHFVNNYKPIACVSVKGVQEAFAYLESIEGRNLYVYLTIYTDSVLEQHDIKKMREIYKEIVSILPIFPEKAEVWKLERKQLSIRQQFRAFYQYKKGTLPSQETEDLFFQLIEEETL